MSSDTSTYFPWGGTLIVSLCVTDRELVIVPLLVKLFGTSAAFIISS